MPNNNTHYVYQHRHYRKLQRSESFIDLLFYFQYVGGSRKVRMDEQSQVDCGVVGCEF